MDFVNRLSNQASLWSALRTVALLQSVGKEGHRLVIDPEINYNNFIDDVMDIIDGTDTYPEAGEG
jgi:hypothetical protein